MPRHPVAVWDIATRLFHWSLAALFVANALATRPGKDLHQWIGYAIGALVAFRILWGLVGPRHARFADFPPSPSAAMGQLAEMASGRRNIHVGHSPLGALMVYNLILTMAGLVLSGYAMTTVTFFGVEWVEDVHEVLVTWAELSVLAHIAAVVLESRRLRVNLPKSMVTGYKDLPEESRPAQGTNALS